MAAAGHNTAAAAAWRRRAALRGGRSAGGAAGHGHAGAGAAWHAAWRAAWCAAWCGTQRTRQAGRRTPGRAADAVERMAAWASRAGGDTCAAQAGSRAGAATAACLHGRGADQCGPRSDDWAGRRVGHAVAGWLGQHALLRCRARPGRAWRVCNGHRVGPAACHRGRGVRAREGGRQGAPWGRWRGWGGRGASRGRGDVPGIGGPRGGRRARASAVLGMRLAGHGAASRHVGGRAAGRAGHHVLWPLRRRFHAAHAGHTARRPRHAALRPERRGR
mmetsp:Transcript_12853/g.32776  ORF Transcript_12853/g.32776 Transcript_12853/m.32776 type:complete len:275 (+) Transcript_12853:1157-1981(+)